MEKSKRKKSRSKQLKNIYIVRMEKGGGERKKKCREKFFIVDTNECVVKWISSA